MENMFDQIGMEVLTATQKEAEKLNSKAKELSIKTVLDISKNDSELKKGIEELKKEIDKVEISNKEKETAKIKKVAEAEKSLKVLEANKKYLTDEGIDISKIAEVDINKEAEKLKSSPKAPFDIYVQDTKMELNLETGKRYSMEEIKEMVTAKQEFFYLETATAKYNEKHNTVFFTMTGSTKGSSITNFKNIVDKSIGDVITIDNGFIYSSNKTGSVRIKLAFAGSEKIKASFDLKEVSKVSSVITNEAELTITNSKLTIKSEKINTVIPAYKSVIEINLFDSKTHEVNTAELILAIKRVEYAISMNDNKMILKGINFTSNSIEASDSFVAAIVNYKTFIKGTFIGTDLSKTISKFPNFQIGSHEKAMVLKSQNGSIINIAKISGTFPLIEKIFEVDSATAIANLTIETSELLEAVKTIDSIADKCCIENIGNNTTISACETKTKMVINLTSLMDTDYKVNYPTNNLKNILNVIKRKEINIEFHENDGKERPSIILDGANRHAVGPVRIN